MKNEYEKQKLIFDENFMEKFRQDQNIRFGIFVQDKIIEFAEHVQVSIIDLAESVVDGVKAIHNIK